MPFDITAYTPKIQPGAYQAVCTSVETRSAKDGSGDFRVWEFTLRDGTGRTVSASSSLATSPKSKAGKWLASLLGHTPAVGETVEPVGKPCTIIVELNEDNYERVAMVTAPADAPVQSPVKPAQVYEGMEQDEKASPEKGEVKAEVVDLPF